MRFMASLTLSVSCCAQSTWFTDWTNAWVSDHCGGWIWRKGWGRGWRKVGEEVDVKVKIGKQVERKMEERMEEGVERRMGEWMNTKDRGEDGNEGQAHTKKRIGRVGGKMERKWM